MFEPQEHLIYLQEYQLLIYKPCKHTLSPSWIQRHLRIFHKVIPNPIHQKLIEYTSTLILKDESMIQVPIETIPAIPYLATPIEGFRYSRYIS
jgi:hypothetical protein